MSFTRCFQRVHVIARGVHYSYILLPLRPVQGLQTRHSHPPGPKPRSVARQESKRGSFTKQSCSRPGESELSLGHGHLGRSRLRSLHAPSEPKRLTKRVFLLLAAAPCYEGPVKAQDRGTTHAAGPRSYHLPTPRTPGNRAPKGRMCLYFRLSSTSS